MSTVLPLAIRADHPAYAGHFPTRPILPGVVLLDAAITALATLPGMPDGPAGPGPAQIRSAKFLSPAVPGEVLTLHYERLATGGFNFEIRVDTRVVARGALSFRGADTP